jgi:hypothetical protein
MSINRKPIVIRNLLDQRLGTAKTSLIQNDIEVAYGQRRSQ